MSDIELEEARKQNEFIEKKFNEFLSSVDGHNYITMMYKMHLDGWEAKEEYDRQNNKKCVWSFEAEFDASYWEADCNGRGFSFNEGTPTENGFIYCPYCGKLIEESEVVK